MPPASNISNETHYGAVPPSRNPEPVRCFGCTTAELKSMADWLKHCRRRTVAMQSTGVYWMAVADILEEAGLEVYLVNARDRKNLPGRKTDEQETVADEAAHLWFIAEFVSPVAGDPHPADVLA